MPRQRTPQSSRPSFGLRQAPRNAPPAGWGIPEDAARRTPRRSLAQAAPSGDEESQVLAHVNAIRARRGLPALSYNPSLHKAARDHSVEQKRHNYMGHGSPDPRRRTLAQRMKLAGYSGRAFGEVVAKGFRSTQGVVQGWMNSPSHREILLDRELTEAAFSRVGTYWTGNFGRPFAPGESQRGTWHRVPVGMMHDNSHSPSMVYPSITSPNARNYRPVPSWPAPVHKHIAYSSSPMPYDAVQRPSYGQAPAEFQRPSYQAPGSSSDHTTWGNAKPYRPRASSRGARSSDGSDVGWVPTSVTPEWRSNAVPYQSSGASSDWNRGTAFNSVREGSFDGHESVPFAARARREGPRASRDRDGAARAARESQVALMATVLQDVGAPRMQDLKPISVRFGRHPNRVRRPILSMRCAASWMSEVW